MKAKDSLGAIPGASMPSQYTGKGGDLPGPLGRKLKITPGGGGKGAYFRKNEAGYARDAKYDGTRAIGTQEWVQDRIAAGDIEGGMAAGQTGTSIFDPVLCELAYRWFCPPGGQVLDPFAGGSVRGIVASRLGRRYFGVDLSARQVAANQKQGEAICVTPPAPEWAVGDSRELATIAAGIEADFVFSCPPYADLEIYSDDPADISTMAYPAFREAYAAIVAAACALLKPDRFACFVVGDVRDKRGFYRNLPGHTIEAFQAAGLSLYNEAILVTVAGSLPIRAGKQFEASRKLGKTHQNVLVFCKGDPRAATEVIGACEFGDPEAEVVMMGGGDSGTEPLATPSGEVV